MIAASQVAKRLKTQKLKNIRKCHNFIELLPSAPPKMKILSALVKISKKKKKNINWNFTGV